MRRAFNISHALSQIARSAQPLSFINSAEYDPLMAAIGNARLVLIGEASHGTVRLALPDSVESLFHETALGDFLLLLRERAIRETMSNPLLERATVSFIGPRQSASATISRLACRISSTP